MRLKGLTIGDLKDHLDHIYATNKDRVEEIKNFSIVLGFETGPKDRVSLIQFDGELGQLRIEPYEF